MWKAFGAVRLSPCPYRHSVMHRVVKCFIYPKIPRARERVLLTNWVAHLQAPGHPTKLASAGPTCLSATLPGHSSDDSVESSASQPLTWVRIRYFRPLQMLSFVRLLVRKLHLWDWMIIWVEDYEDVWLWDFRFSLRRVWWFRAYWDIAPCGLGVDVPQSSPWWWGQYAPLKRRLLKRDYTACCIPKDSNLQVCEFFRYVEMYGVFS
jgi:hypothetical protein